jgi:Tol biopolymer transport system component
MHRSFLLASVLLVLLAAGCGGASHVARDYQIAYVTSRDAYYAIYGVRADGSGQGRLTDGGPEAVDSPAELFFQTEPAFSSDGTKIAFASRRDRRSHIYVMRADGSGTMQLTTGKHEDSSPTWSPDGKHIAFERDRMLFVVEPSGAGLRRIGTTIGGEDRDPSWSPDGRFIAYVRREQGFSTHEIWRIHPDGTEPRQVTRLNASSYTPSWSPDSRRVAFSSNANDGRYQLYTITAAGKDLRRLTYLPADYFDPSWSSDGTELVFERDGVVYVRRHGTEDAVTEGPNDGTPVWRPSGEGSR